MNWESWDKIEETLVSLEIKPIVAIVPNNKDKRLIFSSDNDLFWLKVRRWQKLGWSIAVHGYQHKYITQDPGLMKLNKYSEFSGLPYKIQINYLQNALSIFEKNGVFPDVWIAPAHSFDKVTVQVLYELGIKIISDGFYLKPVRKMNMIWIPQQLWRFRDFSYGIWTVCYHINNLNKSELEKICKDLNKYRGRITYLDNILNNTKIQKINMSDAIFSFIWRSMVKVKRMKSKLK